jgi:hypothetical protein
MVKDVRNCEEDDLVVTSVNNNELGFVNISSPPLLPRAQVVGFFFKFSPF